MGKNPIDVESVRSGCLAVLHQDEGGLVQIQEKPISSLHHPHLELDFSPNLATTLPVMETENHERGEPENESQEPIYGLPDASRRAISEAVESGDSELVKSLASDLHPADIADYLSTATYEERAGFLAITREDFNPEVLVNLNREILDEVMETLGLKESAAALTKLDTEDAVQVIGELAEPEQQEILEALPDEYRVALEKGLSYPEESVGRLMRKKFVSVPERWNVGQTIDYLRDFQDLPDDFHEIYVLDSDHRVTRCVLVSRIIRNLRSVQIHDIADECEHTLTPDIDQEDASYLFRQYGLVSAPVLDESGKLLGVVYVEDMVGVIEESMEDDIMRLGGVQETDIFTAVPKTASRRFPWLFMNLITAFTSSSVITMFSGTIQSMVALAALMPIVASLGGNAGTQALTVAVRGIANKEITSTNTARVIMKELAVGFMNGALIALIAAAAAFLFTHEVRMALIFGGAIILNFCVAGLAGSLIPITLERFKVDPAVASGVFLTALTDLTAFFVFLGLATLLLIG